MQIDLRRIQGKDFTVRFFYHMRKNNIKTIHSAEKFLNTVIPYKYPNNRLGPSTIKKMLKEIEEFKSL